MPRIRHLNIQTVEFRIQIHFSTALGRLFLEHFLSQSVGDGSQSVQPATRRLLSRWLVGGGSNINGDVIGGFDDVIAGRDVTGGRRIAEGRGTSGLAGRSSNTGSPSQYQRLELYTVDGKRYNVHFLLRLRTRLAANTTSGTGVICTV